MTVVTLCKPEFLPVVEECAQVDVCRRVSRSEIQHLLIGGNRLVLRVGIFLEGDAAGKPRGYFVIAWRRFVTRNRRAGDDFFTFREIHEKLPGDRFEELALVTEGYTVVCSRGARFEERLFDASS